MKIMLLKLRVIPLLLLTPIASIFEVTGESYFEKISRTYKNLINILKM